MKDKQDFTPLFYKQSIDKPMIYLHANIYLKG